jgi:hypothetical protein
MKEDRKRMNALGGRGMYDASRFLPCDPLGLLDDELMIMPSSGKIGEAGGVDMKDVEDSGLSS